MTAVRGRPPKRPEKRLVPIIILVPPQIKKNMQEAAEKNNTSMSQYVREILEKW